MKTVRAELVEALSFPLKSEKEKSSPSTSLGRTGVQLHFASLLAPGRAALSGARIWPE
jgi:hypothetical protein